jgi:cysteine desulfurase
MHTDNTGNMIYLDYASSTPLDPAVSSKMIECLDGFQYFGNPSATNHFYGVQARKMVETARSQVASLINAQPSQIVWTSGATEAINLALKGAAACQRQFGSHLITVNTEHKAVLSVFQSLESCGFRVTYLECKPDGRLDMDVLTDAITPETILISIMHVNNETGIIHDIGHVSDIARHNNIILHVDAAQSLGKLPVDVVESKIDLMSMTSHKLYGPKGIGALYVASQSHLSLHPQIHGGGQESGLRSGTLPTHQIIGMGEAYQIAQAKLEADNSHCFQLQRFFIEMLSQISGVSFNTSIQYSVPNIINITIEGVNNLQLMQALKDVAISSGSACSSDSGTGSHVLRAMSLNDDQIHSAVRLSWGRFTTLDEVKRACVTIKAAIRDLQKK